MVKRNYFLIVCLTFMAFSTTAQESNDKKWGLKFDYGLSRTFHYNVPVDFLFCLEGCNILEQKARLSSNGSVNIYRIFNNKNSVKLGLGFSQYRFSQKAQSTFDLGTFENNTNLNMFGISLGYRYFFNSKDKISPFLESELIYETETKKKLTLIGNKVNGFALKSQFGLSFKIAPKLSLITQLFFKTALSTYTKDLLDKNYIPYAYGIEFGLML